MILLTTKAQWLEWVPKNHRDDEPPVFPCWAYDEVESFTWEETTPLYLHLADLEKMAEELRTAPQPIGMAGVGLIRGVMGLVAIPKGGA